MGAVSKFRLTCSRRCIATGMCTCKLRPAYMQAKARVTVSYTPVHSCTCGRVSCMYVCTYVCMYVCMSRHLRDIPDNRFCRDAEPASLLTARCIYTRPSISRLPKSDPRPLTPNLMSRTAELTLNLRPQALSSRP